MASPNANITQSPCFPIEHHPCSTLRRMVVVRRLLRAVLRLLILSLLLFVSGCGASHESGLPGGLTKTELPPKTRSTPSTSNATPSRQTLTPSTVEPGDRYVAVGLWGGEGVGLEVTRTGAFIDFDCAHAVISEPLALDGQNYFDVTGTYVRERGVAQLGILAVAQEHDGHLARFNGVIEGKTMTLTVELVDTNEHIGIYTLVFGEEPHVRKCM